MFYIKKQKDLVLTNEYDTVYQQTGLHASAPSFTLCCRKMTCLQQNIMA